MTDRTFPAPLGDERQVALDYLDFHRQTLAWKVSGLTQQQLAQAHPPSTMTLGGLVKHLALVEDSWFTAVFLGHEMPPPWAGVDWKAQPDWEWDTAPSHTPEELVALWDTSVARSRAAIEGRGFDDVAVRERWGKQLNLRWIVVHMIEEYSRHNGHADLIRESIDGLTGE